VRNGESATEDFIEWLNAVRARIPSSQAVESVEPSRPQPMSPQEHSEQLLSLNQALLEQSSSKVPETETEAVVVQR